MVHHQVVYVIHALSPFRFVVVNNLPDPVRAVKYLPRRLRHEFLSARLVPAQRPKVRLIRRSTDCTPTVHWNVLFTERDIVCSILRQSRNVLRLHQAESGIIAPDVLTLRRENDH